MNNRRGAPTKLSNAFQKQRFLVSICLILLLILPVFGVSDDDKHQDGETVAQLIKRAEKMTRKGEIKEAEEILRRVVKTNPQETRATLALAYLLLKKRQLEESYDLAFDVAKADPENAFAFAILGGALLASGDFTTARIALNNALALNKREALAIYGLGMMDFYENRIFESLDKLRKAEYLQPNEPDYAFAIGKVAARAERYKEAAAAYEKFLRIALAKDDDRRERIRGLVRFLRFLGNRSALYDLGGAKATTVPIELIGNRPVIELRLNNKDEPLKFVLDTGSGISVISEQTAERLKIKEITRGGQARALGGTGKFEIVYGFLKTIDIGDVRVRNVPVYIREFKYTGHQVDGYIGISLISKFLTTVDYGNLTFSLERVGERAVQTEKSDGGESQPLRLTSSGFLSGRVQVEGVEHPLNFIVDTGASISVISDDLAKTKEISGFINDERLRVIGAAGITDNVPLFLLPRVTFGAHSRLELRAVALDLDLINEASGFEQAGILGGNFLRNYRLTFDFENSHVIFFPNEDK